MIVVMFRTLVVMMMMMGRRGLIQARNFFLQPRLLGLGHLPSALCTLLLFLEFLQRLRRLLGRFIAGRGIPLHHGLGSMISLSQPKAEAYGAHSGGRFTFVLRLSVLALAAPRLQLEEEHEASQNFIVNDTSEQNRAQSPPPLLCLSLCKDLPIDFAPRDGC